MELRTSRLLLRPWRKADLPPFAALNADPEVRRWFPGTLTQAESDASAARLQAHIAAHGFGFWAVEAPGAASFIGFVGLQRVAFAAPFAPAVEIGWRLARAQWGKGYATEAARAALAHGFEALGFAEVVSFAVPGNAASRRVMERIGMRHDPAGDFDHPALPRGISSADTCSTAPGGAASAPAQASRRRTAWSGTDGPGGEVEAPPQSRRLSENFTLASVPGGVAAGQPIVQQRLMELGTQNAPRPQPLSLITVF